VTLINVLIGALTDGLELSGLSVGAWCTAIRAKLA
jgi:hypothetical protein